MRYVLCVVLLLLGCVGSGVAVQVSDLAQSPALNAPALRQGGLSVLGFVGELPDAPASHAQLSGELAHTLGLWLPTVPLGKPSTLHGASFAVARERLAAGSLDLPFADLRSESGKRFLVSAELRSNEVLHTSSRSREDVNYCTTRVVRVRYRVLDLEQQNVAFQGIVHQEGERCNDNPRSQKGGILGRMLADALTDAMWGTYPAPPRGVWIVRKAARDFASLLPGAEEPEPTPQALSRSKAAQVAL